MRFIDGNDNTRLTRLAAEGVISRDHLEKAVGDHSVILIDVLVEHGGQFPTAPWIAWGIRQGLARMNRTKVTAAFVRERQLSEEGIKALLGAWVFPFAKNLYGQLMVACSPGWPKPEKALPYLGANPVFCVATLSELAELHAAYAAVST